MSTNRFPAICTRCKTAVPAQEGSLEKKYGVWEVTHLEECDEAMRVVTHDDRWGRGTVFESEKFGVVVAIMSEELPDYEDDPMMVEWETFVRAATAEERKEFAEHKAEAKAHCEKAREAEALMDGLAHIDVFREDRDAEHLVLKNGHFYGPNFYANIPVDRSLPIIIHSFHGENCDSMAFKEIEYTDATVELLRWQVEEGKKWKP